MKFQIVAILCCLCFSHSHNAFAEGYERSTEKCNEAYELSQKACNELNSGKVDAAIENLNRAIKLNPSLPNVRQNLAIAYQHKGLKYIQEKEYSKAIEILKEAESMALKEFGFKSSQMLSVLETLSLAYSKDGQIEKAEEYKTKSKFLCAEVAKMKKDPTEGNLENFLNGADRRLNGFDRARIRIKKIHSR